MVVGIGREERDDHQARVELRGHTAVYLATPRGWPPCLGYRVRGRGNRVYGNRARIARKVASLDVTTPVLPVLQQQ